MTILGIAALIALVILGVMVLRVKSDPLENNAIREALAESKRNRSVLSPEAPQDSDCTLPPKT
jgi:hypothetical protein